MQDQDFDRLLAVCRLRLSEKEHAKIKTDIDEIINYFNSIEKVDTAKLEPSYHPIQIEERLREDKVEPFDNPDSLLKGTKTHRFYVVGPDI
ncbi:MAG: Asp-tRNA(Asn)/Glu-tRNA(Gln) amidotransferase subunit GatC [Candidatus Micrarchaeales archaeon]